MAKEEHGLARELRPHILWDGIKEAAKTMLPFLAGLGAKAWVQEHATALMWTAALLVAGLVAFWDQWTTRLTTPSGRQSVPPSETPAMEGREQQAEIARLNQHRIDLLGVISAMKDAHAEQLRVVTEENATLRQANEDLRNPKEGVKRIIDTEVNAATTAALLKDAPDLRVEYASTRGVHNTFTLINEGVDTLYNWSVRPLRISYAKFMAAMSGNPSVASKHRIPVDISIGGGSDLLYDLLPKLPSDAVVSVEFYYEDRKGNAFLRDFEAKSYPNGQVLLQPGPIRPQPHQAI